MAVALGRNVAGARLVWGMSAAASVALALISYRYFLGVGYMPPKIVANAFANPWLAIHIAGAATALLVGSFQFLGGMRAVTWTQVAQYIILIIAYMIPVVMLAYRNTGVPIPHIVYGYTLQKVTEREQQLTKDPKEIAVRDIFKQRAADLDARIKGLPASYNEEKARVEKQLADLRASNAPPEKLKAAEEAVKSFPASPEAARAAMRDHLSRVIEALLEATETEELERARAQIAEQRRRYALEK